MVLFIISRKKEAHQTRESMISSEKLILKHDQDDLIAKKRAGKKTNCFLEILQEKEVGVVTRGSY